MDYNSSFIVCMTRKHDSNSFGNIMIGNNLYLPLSEEEKKFLHMLEVDTDESPEHPGLYYVNGHDVCNEIYDLEDDPELFAWAKKQTWYQDEEDFMDSPLESILQGCLQRMQTMPDFKDVEFLNVFSSFYAWRNRPDAIGGAVSVISPTKIISKNLYDVAEEIQAKMKKKAS